MGRVKTRFITGAACAVIGLAVVLLSLYSKHSRSEANDNLEIYEQGSFSLDAVPPSEHPLVIQLPESFRYGSTKGDTRSWGANLLAYYPSFSSPSDPSNAGFDLTCAGYCNGRILVAINYRPRAINNSRGNMDGVVSPNMADFIGRIAVISELDINGDRISSKSLGSTVTKLGTELGFDEGYLINYPGGNGVPPSSRKLLFRFGADHVHYDLTAECSLIGNNHHCSLHFSLNCDPAIYVKVGSVDIDHVTDLSDVRNKADAFVASMVRSEPCH